MSIHPPGLGVIAGRTFDAVLFDLDGTLIDSTATVERSWRRWAAEHGLPMEDFVVTHGVPARQVLAGLVPPAEVDGAFARIEAIEIEDIGDIVVLPGAAAALQAIPAERAAIATSGSTPLARGRIEATGLRAPAVVITANDVAVGKPHPDPYLLAARRLGVDPARCVVVEDAPAGLEAARAAGCATISVTTTHTPDEVPADAVLDSLADVVFVPVPGGVRIEPAP